MAEEIHTHSVSRGIAQTDELVLDETKTTRVVFRPLVHPGGIRGQLIRQKIGNDGSWKDIQEVDFRKLPPDCGVSIDISTDGVRILFDRLSLLYPLQDKGVFSGDREYVVGQKHEVLVINDKTKARAIRELVEKGYSRDFWTRLANEKPDLASELAAAKLQTDREKAIDEFIESLSSHPSDEDHWHSLFKRNPWMLQAAFSAAVFMLDDEVYLGGKGPVGRNGLGGVATDFLLSDDSTKSFALVEIKTPDTQLIGARYRGKHEDALNETYSMHGALSGSIVQLRNQMTVAVEDFSTVLKRGYPNGLNAVHPKGVLVIGTAAGLTERQMHSFNEFRHGLYSLTVLTFDELLRRLEVMYRDPRSKPSRQDTQQGEAQ